MRSDMSKVIVERPRRRRPTRGAGSEYPRGRLKNARYLKSADEFCGERNRSGFSTTALADVRLTSARATASVTR